MLHIQFNKFVYRWASYLSNIQKDQIEDYAERKEIGVEEIEHCLR